MQKARLAEQAERYDDMAAAMKSVSQLHLEVIFKKKKRKKNNDKNEPLDHVPPLGCVRLSVRNSCVKGAAPRRLYFKGTQLRNDHVHSLDGLVAFT